MWRVEAESHSLVDGTEAVENFLEAEDFDWAGAVAVGIAEALQRFRQLAGVVTFAGEVLRRLPEGHSEFAVLADLEGQALIALGYTELALKRYQQLRGLQQAKVEPNAADNRRVGVIYERIGDLYRRSGAGGGGAGGLRAVAGDSRAVGGGGAGASRLPARPVGVVQQGRGPVPGAGAGRGGARRPTSSRWRLRSGWRQAEPERADYQRDLSVSYNRVGDLYRAMGQGEAARAGLRAVAGDCGAVGGRRSRSEPTTSATCRCRYNKVGDLYRALGQGEEARAGLREVAGDSERLAAAEPERADYQRDLSVSYNKVGDLYRAWARARRRAQAYEQSLAIRSGWRRRSRSGPTTSATCRCRTTGWGTCTGRWARGRRRAQAYEQSLAIRERLAAAEPERADYQRDLSVSYNKVGGPVPGAGAGGGGARRPTRSRWRFGAVGGGGAGASRLPARPVGVVQQGGGPVPGAGPGGGGAEAYEKSLAIRERLAAAEPERADYQRDLSVSYNKVGDLYRALGQGEEARRPTAVAGDRGAVGGGGAGASRLPARPVGVVQQGRGPVPGAGPGGGGAGGLRAVAGDSRAVGGGGAGASRLPARPVGVIRQAGAAG